MADPSTTVLVGVWKTAKKLRDVLAHSDRAREASEKLRSKMNSCIAVLDLLRLPITPSASEMPSDDLGVFRAAAEDIQATLTRCERIIGKTQGGKTWSGFMTSIYGPQLEALAQELHENLQTLNVCVGAWQMNHAQVLHQQTLSMHHGGQGGFSSLSGTTSIGALAQSPGSRRKNAYLGVPLGRSKSTEAPLSGRARRSAMYMEETEEDVMGTVPGRRRTEAEAQGVVTEKKRGFFSRIFRRKRKAKSEERPAQSTPSSSGGLKKSKSGKKTKSLMAVAIGGAIATTAAVMLDDVGASATGSIHTIGEACEGLEGSDGSDDDDDNEDGAQRGATGIKRRGQRKPAPVRTTPHVGAIGSTRSPKLSARRATPMRLSQSRGMALSPMAAAVMTPRKYSASPLRSAGPGGLYCATPSTPTTPAAMHSPMGGGLKSARTPRSARGGPVTIEKIKDAAKTLTDLHSRIREITVYRTELRKRLGTRESVLFQLRAQLELEQGTAAAAQAQVESNSSSQSGGSRDRSRGSWRLFSRRRRKSTGSTGSLGLESNFLLTNLQAARDQKLERLSAARGLGLHDDKLAEEVRQLEKYLASMKAAKQQQGSGSSSGSGGSQKPGDVMVAAMRRAGELQAKIAEVEMKLAQHIEVERAAQDKITNLRLRAETKYVELGEMLAHAPEGAAREAGREVAEELMMPYAETRPRSARSVRSVRSSRVMGAQPSWVGTWESPTNSPQGLQT